MKRYDFVRVTRRPEPTNEVKAIIIRIETGNPISSHQYAVLKDWLDMKKIV